MNGWIQWYNVGKWIFSRTKIFKTKIENWIRFTQLCKKKKKRADLKKAAEVDKSKITRRVNLANLKSDVD